jgi:hypothetical protein
MLKDSPPPHVIKGGKIPSPANAQNGCSRPATGSSRVAGFPEQFINAIEARPGVVSHAVVISTLYCVQVPTTGVAVVVVVIVEPQGTSAKS